jgi:PilZ domain-containing protein
MERRAAPRHRVFKGGTISFAQAPSVDCIVRNISATGACLEIENPERIPDAFMLVIRPEHVQHSCHVAWCGGRRMGVRFG